jgi:hypothetical protein
MSHEVLRGRATANRSVNADLATYWELRWHDPFFLEAWQAFNAASAVWDRTWKNMDFKYLRPICPGRSSVFWPDVTAIPEDHPARSICQAYVAAKARYHAAIDHYADA